MKLPVYVKNALIILLASYLFLGCETKYYLPENPLPVPCCPHPAQIRIALVLGGGGARGIAHVGVLEEFEKAGIPVDVIVGCSAGSIIGALYADCPNAHHVKKILRPLKTWDILDINIWYARYGLVRGNSLRNFLRHNLHCRYFEDMKIPLYIVASDVIRGELVVLNSGPVIPAIHASSAVPFVFSPVHLYDRLLVDGGVVDPVPVRTAKETGAHIVVAVDLSELLPETCPTNLFQVATRSAEIKFLLQSESCTRGADVIIKPDLCDVGMFDNQKCDMVYEAGRQAAIHAIPKIQELLSQKGLLYQDEL